MARMMLQVIIDRFPETYQGACVDGIVFASKHTTDDVPDLYYSTYPYVQWFLMDIIYMTLLETSYDDAEAMGYMPKNLHQEYIETTLPLEVLLEWLN
jgi:hypothetical protein